MMAIECVSGVEITCQSGDTFARLSYRKWAFVVELVVDAIRLRSCEKPMLEINTFVLIGEGIDMANSGK